MPTRDDPQAALRAAIYRRRRELGLSQQQLADRLGIPRLLVHRIEVGRKWIRAPELRLLSIELGIDLLGIGGRNDRAH